ncbi:MAG TPA: hypothetical protein VFJ14_14540 [Nocardioidaceae bacterium]|jgi:hypothetical protein|nr:hypothetical protein [Nocardioidaceae bacterium]
MTGHLTAEQLTERFPGTTREWWLTQARAKRIGSVKVGQRRYFTEDDVAEYVARNHHRPADATGKGWGQKS